MYGKEPVSSHANLVRFRWGSDRAYIDPDKCKECGMCARNCPYNAIADLIRPCKKACPVGAITMDE